MDKARLDEPLSREKDKTNESLTKKWFNVRANHGKELLAVMQDLRTESKNLLENNNNDLANSWN